MYLGGMTPQSLGDGFALVRFITEHLEAPQMVISDLADNQLLLTRDGVDLFNNLGSLEIELSEIDRQIREGQVENNMEKTTKNPIGESFMIRLVFLPLKFTYARMPNGPEKRQKLSLMWLHF